MKKSWLFLGILVLLSTTSTYGLLIKSKTAHVNLDTEKVSRISGPINELLLIEYITSLEATREMIGDRVIIINSQGGQVGVGLDIIKLMKAEQDKGVRQICVVEAEASSMAFNILTHCDVRLATASSIMTVHKVAAGGWDPNIRPTAKNLRTLANELERTDEQFRWANSEAMHISLAEYDEKADEETTWRAQKLYKMGYLQGITKSK